MDQRQEAVATDAIRIEGLSKSFGDLKAVDNLSFVVKTGELFAFLGVNGAGKSTTISMICGQLKPDAGDIEIKGVSIARRSAEAKRSLGVVFQDSALDRSLTVGDNLKYRASLYGLSGEAYKTRLEELSEALDLKPILRRQLSRLSGGQRRRADIARALIHRPEILILDEPTTGLDPQTRKAIWATVNRLRKEKGMTVLLTTHYMEEAADADYVVIIDAGKAVAKGTPLELKNRYTGDFITVYGHSEEEVRALGFPYEKIRDAYRIAIPNTAQATSLIVSRPDFFADYEVEKGKMDDVFLAATGKEEEGK